MDPSPLAAPTHPITRRRSLALLLAFSVTATVAGIVVPIISYLWPKESGAGYGGPTDVGSVTAFPPESGTVVSVGSKPVMVVNTKTGSLKAFSAICTHLGCVVQWDDRKDIIHCPCHDGFFNPVNGAVVSGPPPSPLTAYDLAIQDGQVLIGEPTGQLYGG
jgi:cytochrome b6-f complex iron-sulfur subunit